MGVYVYHCSEGHAREMKHRMLYGTGIICRCGEAMWRVPQITATNWGGLRPSQGGLHPNIKGLIDSAPKRRDRLAARHEYHERQTEHE